MEEKNSKFSFRMKIILTSLMIGILIMLAILFNSTVNAYNLPSYEVNKDTSIEDDFKAFGMSVYDYQSNNDGKDEWQVVYIAENYTESNGYIVNYIYLYNQCLDNTIVCFNLKMNLNNQSKFDAVIDDYTRGPDPEEKIGDTWVNREMIMIYSDRLLIGDNDTYHNIIKLRLEANVLNLDEKRVYQTESISYRSYTNSNHTNTIIKTNSLSYSQTYNSVYTDDDRKDNSNIDLPLYQEAWKGYDANENEIYFSYINCGFNTKLSQIKLNNETVPLEFVEHDNVNNISIFKTNAFGLKARGTMTYKINGYYVGSKFYDTSKEDVVFRYVSNLTSVEVEADKTMSHHWAPIGGNYSKVSFILTEKKSGKAITNAISVHCRYTYNGVNYAPTLNVKDNTFSNVSSAVFSILFNGSNRDGVLVHASNVDNGYNWMFGIKIPAESFDILTITYQVKDEIVTGSCYKNGLHIENIDGVDHVSDMNGNNRDKDYGTKDDGLIYGKDKNGNLKDETPTENRPTKYDENFFDKLLDFLNVFFSVTVGVGILILVIQIVSVVANVFRKRD